MADGTRSFDAPDGRDPAALADAYRAHARYVWRVLRHCGVGDADLDDAVQETFLIVVRRLPEFEARASLRTWIYAVAVRVAATRRRSQRREAARREQAGHRMHGAGAADPEAALSKAEAAELVDRLLDELDASKRTVFVLAELEGVKVPEISRILGINPRTVHSRLRLARERFGSALERLRAREAGNRRVARLRPRPLLEQAASDRPPAARRKAAMAALAARIEQGAMPVLPGWDALALGSGWAGTWGLPAAVLAAVGTVAAAVAIASGEPDHVENVPSGLATSPLGNTLSPSEPSPSPLGNTLSPSEPSPSPLGNTLSPSEPSSSPLGNTLSPSEPSPSPLGNTLSPSEPSSSPLGNEHSPSEPSSSPRDTKHSPPGLSPSASGTASTLAAETRLLEQARGALRRGDADAAMAALDAHAAEFPAGLLLDEARSTRLRALCASGRPADATALAERWAPGQPGSRWHDVVAAACR